jgi:adenosylcobinamide-phosphate synthase
MVGRDTEHLNETGITRAAVESVAENTVDGVLAPLFFAFLGGPVAAMAYKAVNTLDSTFGYRNERYVHFGWASARLDDAANYLPARLAPPLIALAALFLGGSPPNALRICRRDGGRHVSPNSGLSEAAVAGALGIRLGGPVRRQGKTQDMPYLGDPLRPLEKDHIRRANALMFGATLTAALVFSAARMSVAVPV